VRLKQLFAIFPHNKRLIFLANIQNRLNESAKFTLSELQRLLEMIKASILPVKPVEYQPVYDIFYLATAILKAVQEFHDRWKGLLGMG